MIKRLIEILKRLFMPPQSNKAETKILAHMQNEWKIRNENIAIGNGSSGYNEFALETYVVVGPDWDGTASIGGSAAMFGIKLTESYKSIRVTGGLYYNIAFPSGSIDYHVMRLDANDVTYTGTSNELIYSHGSFSVPYTASFGKHEIDFTVNGPFKDGDYIYIAIYGNNNVQEITADHSLTIVGIK